MHLIRWALSLFTLRTWERSSQVGHPSRFAALHEVFASPGSNSAALWRPMQRAAMQQRGLGTQGKLSCLRSAPLLAPRLADARATRHPRRATTASAAPSNGHADERGECSSMGQQPGPVHARQRWVLMDVHHSASCNALSRPSCVLPAMQALTTPQCSATWRSSWCASLRQRRWPAAGEVEGHLLMWSQNL